jgi:rhodanese-related sulfurtransferase
MSEITPDEFSERLRTDGEDIIVLDVRHQEDFEDWHIPDSTNIDVYDELTNSPDAAMTRCQPSPRRRRL